MLCVIPPLGVLSWLSIIPKFLRVCIAMTPQTKHCHNSDGYSPTSYRVGLGSFTVWCIQEVVEDRWELWHFSTQYFGFYPSLTLPPVLYLHICSYTEDAVNSEIVCNELKSPRVTREICLRQLSLLPFFQFISCQASYQSMLGIFIRDVATAVT
jgi:hypothetical protein